MIKSIQMLRGFAAWMVVIHHIQQILLDENIGIVFFKKLFDKFAFGVDIFFIISGFIIYFSASKHYENKIMFLMNRMTRVIPLYWFYTLVAVVICAFIPGAFFYNELTAKPIIRSLLFIPFKNEMLGLYIPFLSVGWTLNYEIIFYICAFIAMCMPFKNFIVKTFSLLAVIYILSYIVKGEDGFYSSSVIFEFTLGSILAHLYSKGYLDLISKKTAYIVLVISSLVLLKSDLVHELRIGIPCFVIVACVLRLENEIKESRPFNFMIKLGNYSYSTYLCHVVILFLLQHVMASYGINKYIIAILALIIIYAISSVSYSLIEIRTASFFRAKKRNITKA
ncbi:acyltransferase family protein [Kluyvera cryocrescens]|uniref:acyltransferase family protein n=1 Tax=Kluyvera cryocrescens TaxID=580 RepID=UPI0039F5D215